MGVAAGQLQFWFEKSGALEKYGSENAFGAAPGGRCLRYTAETVYGLSAMGDNDNSAELKLEAVWEEVNWAHGFLVVLEEEEHIFVEVGGVKAWRKLAKDFKL